MIVGTGNHWVLDVLVGWLVVVAGWVVSETLPAPAQPGSAGSSGSSGSTGSTGSSSSPEIPVAGTRVHTQLVVD